MADISQFVRDASSLPAGAKITGPTGGQVAVAAVDQAVVGVVYIDFSHFSFRTSSSPKGKNVWMETGRKHENRNFMA